MPSPRLSYTTDHHTPGHSQAAGSPAGTQVRRAFFFFFLNNGGKVHSPCWARLYRTRWTRMARGRDFTEQAWEQSQTQMPVCRVSLDMWAVFNGSVCRRCFRARAEDRNALLPLSGGSGQALLLPSPGRPHQTRWRWSGTAGPPAPSCHLECHLLGESTNSRANPDKEGS